MIDQGELFSIPNPCKGVCTSNSRGYCRGCLRSRQERFHWHEFSPFQQQLIANACEKRRLKILAARDGIAEDDFGEEPDQADLFDSASNPAADAPSHEQAPPPSSAATPAESPVENTPETKDQRPPPAVQGNQIDLF